MHPQIAYLLWLICGLSYRISLDLGLLSGSSPDMKERQFFRVKSFRASRLCRSFYTGLVRLFTATSLVVLVDTTPQLLRLRSNSGPDGPFALTHTAPPSSHALYALPSAFSALYRLASMACRPIRHPRKILMGITIDPGLPSPSHFFSYHNLSRVESIPS